MHFLFHTQAVPCSSNDPFRTHPPSLHGPTITSLAAHIQRPNDRSALSATPCHPHRARVQRHQRRPPPPNHHHNHQSHRLPPPCRSSARLMNWPNSSPRTQSDSPTQIPRSLSSLSPHSSSFSTMPSVPRRTPYPPSAPSSTPSLPTRLLPTSVPPAPAASENADKLHPPLLLSLKPRRSMSSSFKAWTHASSGSSSTSKLPRCLAS